MILFRMLCITIFSPFILFADPWGKDADLAVGSLEKERTNPPQPSFIAQLGDLAISFHQEVISPADGPRSHYLPSSSQYTKEAMQRYGFFIGVLLGCDRLMRENEDPWVYLKIVNEQGITMKVDPVPVLDGFERIYKGD